MLNLVLHLFTSVMAQAEGGRIKRCPCLWSCREGVGLLAEREAEEEYFKLDELLVRRGILRGCGLVRKIRY